MKYLVPALLVIILFSCNKFPDELKENLACVTCAGELVNKNYGPDSTLTIYNVLSCNTYYHCDSLVFDPLSHEYVPPYVLDRSLLCSEEDYYLAKENGESTCPYYIPTNSYADAINSKFEIDGIENFPYNFITFTLLEDTLFTRRYENYTNSGNAFAGYFSTDITIPGTIYRIIEPEGDVKYELILYKDFNRKETVDTIRGLITLIRTPQECEPINCFPKDENDPMLIPYGVVFE